jgi:hypothetical protein
MGRAQDFYSLGEGGSFFSCCFNGGGLKIVTYYGMADLKGMYLLAVICRFCK